MAVDEFLGKFFKTRAVFHFTDVRNLPSIKANGGLFSAAELRRKGIKVEAPGGNGWSQEADQLYGMDEYVHLCFQDNHPMEYIARKNGHIGETRFLSISPSVMTVPGVKFSPGVSNKKDVPILDFGDALGKPEHDFEVLLTKQDYKDKNVQARLQPARKYELLTPAHVPAALIWNL